MAHLSIAEYSAELFHKIFCRNVVCDVIKSMASDLAEYSAAVEQGPGPLHTAESNAASYFTAIKYFTYFAAELSN